MLKRDREWFRVEVTDHYGQIVAIEPGMLCGREINQMEEAKIREAIGHLQGFVGSGNPSDEYSSVETGTAPLAQQLRNAAAVSDLRGFLATHKVEGVVSGSELEESIRRARSEIASWPDSVKRAMGVPLETSQWSLPDESQG